MDRNAPLDCERLAKDLIEHPSLFRQLDNEAELRIDRLRNQDSIDHWDRTTAALRGMYQLLQEQRSGKESVII